VFRHCHGPCNVCCPTHQYNREYPFLESNTHFESIENCQTGRRFSALSAPARAVSPATKKPGEGSPPGGRSYSVLAIRFRWPGSYRQISPACPGWGRSV
jgi:hypothetical protein